MTARTTQTLDAASSPDAARPADTAALVGSGEPAASTRYAEVAVRLGGYASVVFGGAIFGFFYAWVCSTMWGLDDADPRVAIAAMQAMNASVRNAVFFPAFFLTPVVMGATAIGARAVGSHRAAARFGAGAVVYLLGGLILTATINVPMNEDLATVVIPDSIEEARAVWSDYSGTWQIYNAIRTVFSGISLVLAAAGLRSLGRR